jgi:hypothetical protein
MHLPVIGHARIPARKKTMFDERPSMRVTLNAMAGDKPNVRKDKLAKTMRGVSADRHDQRACTNHVPDLFCAFTRSLTCGRCPFLISASLMQTIVSQVQTS